VPASGHGLTYGAVDAVRRILAPKTDLVHSTPPRVCTLTGPLAELGHAGQSHQTGGALHARAALPL